MRSRRVTHPLRAIPLLFFCSSCGSDPVANILPSTECDNDALGGVCVVGHCRVSSSARPLPEGARLTLAEVSPPTGELYADTLGLFWCSVSLPKGTVAIELSLSITQDAPPPAGSVLFEHAAADRDVSLSASGPVGSAVVGFVLHSATYGATVKPGPWLLDHTLGSELLGSSDEASLLRNLSATPTYSGFFDGTHFFVANGSRILIFDGLPKSPSDLPTVVLGQSDLNTIVTATSASSLGGSNVYGLWSDGQRLAAVTGSRVLIWQQIPKSNLAPADIVLGQGDFSSNKTNAGGISAASLSNPTAISSDGTKLVVADTGNHRILVWSTFPQTSGQPADLVIGQPDFSSFAPAGGNLPVYSPEGVAVGASGLFISSTAQPGLSFVKFPLTMNASESQNIFPWILSPKGKLSSGAAIALSPSGGLAVRDFGLMRVALTRAPPAAGAEVDYVLGQPDPLHVSRPRFADGSDINPARVTASSIGAGIGLQAGGAAMVVPDSRRVLIYDKAPTYNYEPASRVLGQPGFTVNERADFRAVSRATLASPADVAARGDVVAVADKSNNRVLLFHAADVAVSGASAFAVVGQTTDSAYTANLDWRSAGAGTLSGPEGVALDGKRLIVSDSENHRVLIWNTVPTSTGVPADLVLGQSDFSGHRPNHGRGDASPVDGFSDPAADGFFYPTGVASDGQHLFVADRLNHRVLVWDNFPSTNGQPADRVLGQPTMEAVGVHGGMGPFIVTADGFNMPTGLALDGTTLWVADTDNNRVVRWENATTAKTPSAWLGQVDGTSISNANYLFSAGSDTGDNAPPSPTTAASSLRPRAIAVAGGKVFVSETDSNRVHMFDSASLAPIGVLGQPSNTSFSVNSSGVNAASLSEPMGMSSDGTHLYVADARDHRVLGYPLSSVATGASATTVTGQASMFTNGFNQSSVASLGGTIQPRGLARVGATLYLADTGNNRVFSADVAGVGWVPKRVFGQPNSALALPNAAEGVTAHGLKGPRGVLVVGDRLMVADTGNHRVVMFDVNLPTPDAAVVLGQPSFSGGVANAGGVSLSSLQQPSGLCSDGTKLAVVDTVNHRVLVWSKLPTVSSVAADVVLGQADAASNAANRGSAAAAGDSLAFPQACIYRKGQLLIADTGNNRVLSFRDDAITGAAAMAVLGQPDVVTRTPASSVLDTSHFAGPSALASDGTNLYVSDRDLGRVVVLGADLKIREVLGGIGTASQLRAGSGIAVEKTSLFTSRLYVSETSADRVLVVSQVSRLLGP